MKLTTVIHLLFVNCNHIKCTKRLCSLGWLSLISIAHCFIITLPSYLRIQTKHTFHLNQNQHNTHIPNRRNKSQLLFAVRSVTRVYVYLIPLNNVVH